MRTRVYVDGYNLYYGCLKGTPFDPLNLFERILPTVMASIAPNGALTSELDPLSIKFFTAPILEKAAKASDSLRCQEKYHKALNKHRQGRIEIVKGYYSLTEARAKVIDERDPKKWPRDCVEASIWKPEEKQSDVNLSVHAVVDALTGGIEHVVIVTNDTDIEPALKMIRSQTKAAVGLIVPTTDHQCQPNTSLAQHAHWVRSHSQTMNCRRLNCRMSSQMARRPRSRNLSPGSRAPICSHGLLSWEPLTTGAERRHSNGSPSQTGSMKTKRHLTFLKMAMEECCSSWKRKPWHLARTVADVAVPRSRGRLPGSLGLNGDLIEADTPISPKTWMDTPPGYVPSSSQNQN